MDGADCSALVMVESFGRVGSSCSLMGTSLFDRRHLEVMRAVEARLASYATAVERVSACVLLAGGSGVRQPST